MSPVCSGSPLGLLEVVSLGSRFGHVWKQSGKHPDQMSEPPQLVSLDTEEQRFYSAPLLGVGAPHPISKAKRSPLQRKHSFGHNQQLVTCLVCSALSLPLPTGVVSGLLQTLSLSTSRPCFIFPSPHNIWTPPLGAATLPQPKVSNAPFSGWVP